MADNIPGISLIGRFGLKNDPRGAHAVWTIKDRHYIAEVKDVRRDAVTGAYILTTRHLNGEPAPDVALSAVMLLNRESDL